MLCLVLASGFFSASETALFYLSHDELRGLRASRPREHMAAALLSNPDRLLTAILFWNLLINLTYFSSSLVVAHRLGEKAGYGAAGGFSLLSLFAIILFGEVLPKSVAVVYCRRLALTVSWPLSLAVRILDPIRLFSETFLEWCGVLSGLTLIEKQFSIPLIWNEPSRHPN